MRRTRGSITLAFPWLLAACGVGRDPIGPEDEGPVPPPGPNWSVSPIPIEKLARITPLGHNNHPLPVAHTYWLTCDRSWLMPTSRPCVEERLAIRAPPSSAISIRRRMVFSSLKGRRA